MTGDNSQWAGGASAVTPGGWGEPGVRGTESPVRIVQFVQFVQFIQFVQLVQLVQFVQFAPPRLHVSPDSAATYPRFFYFMRAIDSHNVPGQSRPLTRGSWIRVASALRSFPDR